MSIYWNVCAYICVQKFNIKFNRDSFFSVEDFRYKEEDFAEKGIKPTCSNVSGFSNGRKDN